MDPVYPGAVDEIVNLGDHWNQKYLQENRDEIKGLTQEISQTFNLAYEKLANAEKLRKVLFSELAGDMNEKEVSSCAEDLIKEIFYGNLPEIRHFFAAAVTPLGWMGYAQELSTACPARYVLKNGKAGVVSKILHMLAGAAIERGHNVDIYHHTMEPDAIELLVLPNIGVSLVDGECVGITELASDHIINIFDEPINNEIEADWRHIVDEAAASIAEAKEIHNKLEAFYIKAMDFEAVDKIAKEIFGKIWAMAAVKEKNE